jgi:hypothetical protein
VVISTELAKQGKIEEALACARSISDESLHGSVLADISANLAEQEKIEEAALVIQEALVFARGISDEFHKSRTMNKISSQLFQQDKLEEATLVLQEALVFAHEIIDDFDNTIILEEISTELVQQGKLEEAIVCARGISVDSNKSYVLKAISTELAKKGKFEEALECARGIRVESYKSRSMKCISIILGILGKLEKAEKTGLEITQIAQRYSCWSEMSKSIKEKHGWQVALDKVQKLQNEEARLFYLKGWAENLNINETDNTCLKESLPLLAKDTNSIENLLQNYALYELMFGKPTKELMHRLNKCLNVQWAIDITAKFPKESRNSRLTTNVEEWLREIEDEDDQEQVMLWAKQVAKGKITEEEFQVKINTL